MSQKGRPSSHISRILNEAEKNDSTSEKELCSSICERGRKQKAADCLSRLLPVIDPPGDETQKSAFESDLVSKKIIEESARMNPDAEFHFYQGGRMAADDLISPLKKIKIREIIVFLCHQYPALTKHACHMASRELPNDEKEHVLREAHCSIMKQHHGEN